jgi:hypothetical protein
MAVFICVRWVIIPAGNEKPTLHELILGSERLRVSLGGEGDRKLPHALLLAPIMSGELRAIDRELRERWTEFP